MTCKTCTKRSDCYWLKKIRHICGDLVHLMRYDTFIELDEVLAKELPVICRGWVERKEEL